MDKNQNSDAHLACAQKLNELQGLLQNGIVATNSVAVQKSVQKKDSSECKTWWTSWCKAPDGQKPSGRKKHGTTRNYRQASASHYTLTR